MRGLNLTKMFSTILLLVLVADSAIGGLTDYLNGVKTYFGYDSMENKELEGFETRIPYEVAEADEKFISQAMELTGVAFSELDACQHRLILKLKNDCHALNDMQVSKLAVGLLNCQSYIEGRQLYPCTEEMTLKQCTKDMDADAWNSYHLMTNRARAVCYSIRQTQFRGLTEHTVNRLMHASQKQLHTLGKISKDQENLQDLAGNTLDFIQKGHQDLAEQQKDLQKAQLFGQLQIEDNINKLANEKRLIIESQTQLAGMTKLLQDKLSLASQQIEKQSIETSNNHQEVLDDLVLIQEKAQIIFKKIDDSSNILLEQSELATRQYQATLQQLKEMNSTVTSLVELVGGTKKTLEERLIWIIDILGGTDNAIERLYVCLWHLLFLTLSMVASAFTNASFPTRLVVICAIPANLALAILKSEHSADPVILAFFLVLFITMQAVLFNIWKFRQRKREPLFVKDRSHSRGRVSSTHINRHRTEPISTREALPRSISRYSNRSNSDLMPENSEPNAEVLRMSDDFDNFDLHSLPFTRKSPFEPFRRDSPMTMSNGGNKIDQNEELASHDWFDDYISPTPPPSGSRFRSSSRTPSSTGSKATCTAFTRLGTPCKNAATAGRDVCFRHKKGGSIAR